MRTYNRHTHVLSLVKVKKNVLNDTLDQASNRSKFSVVLWILTMLFDYCKEDKGNVDEGASEESTCLVAWFVALALRRMAT